MPRLTFKALQREAAQHALTLERVDKTRGGVRMHYEIIDQENGVWDQFAKLADARRAILGWKDNEVFFIV